MAETLDSTISLALGNVPDISPTESPELYEALLRLHQAIEILVDYYDEVGGIYVTIGDAQTVTGAKTFSSALVAASTLTVTGLATFNGGISVPIEDWHEVGAAGEPAFQNFWVNATGPTGFYKDPLGRVHIRGAVQSGTVLTTIFTLPSAYRPLERLDFAVESNTSYGQVIIFSDGRVQQNIGTNVSFSINCSFRAA